MQINEELTPLNLEREGCQAVGAYLRRRDAWRGLRTQAESQSQRQLQRVTGFNRRVFAKWWDRLEHFLRKVVHTPPSHYEGPVPVEANFRWLFWF